ncbi:ABC transporter permease [Anaerorhabdus furcosa]|uniref:Putative ABC transport system permease protein n=1 Tax=Anaerorhabdus furcosa TaxID=118967 RepID=A0A1T4LLY0_9FIRM|nr:ABC transporter permease [Anaerorhabdus furcosa]SJZ55626.1 putative ABC transport system permease protein [Anaerorhabdus furcosa]
MNFLETCRIVVLNLLENKFKVFLTSLGIFVGTMTIIMVIAIGKGGEKQVLDQFTGLSAETVYVNLNYEKFDAENADKLEKLTLDHVNQIKAESVSIVDIYLLNSSYKEVTIANKNEYVEINAVSENYDKVSNLEIEFGEELNEEDQLSGKNVVVIGGKLAQKYYGVSEAAIGENIKIGNNLYKIKGVLKGKGDGIQGLNPDSSIFLPYETGKKIIGDSGIPRIIGLSDSIDNIGKTKKEIMSTLNYMLDDATFYMIDDAGSRIEAALSSAKTMNVLLISVGMIVFIVGGIGIMNVLFLSVRERTREIGILKALGSQNNEILQQFILESAIISCIGGLAGVIVSQFVFPILTMTNVAVVDTIEGKVMAFAFAVVTGTLFGIYPAYKASKLKPIEALLVE